jgi:hypothetical protein
MEVILEDLSVVEGQVIRQPVAMEEARVASVITGHERPGGGG